MENQSDEEIDPRVQDELESLNRATTDINQWENETSEERSKFRKLLNSATRQLSALSKNNLRSIERARIYYETLKEVKQAQSALERAVQNFQKSSGVHRAAKETISLAEQRLSEFKDSKVDAAWQEMLNLQTIRFMDAERDRSRSEKIHQQATLKYEYLQKKANKLREKQKNSIKRAKKYYETKESLEIELQMQQQKVNGLQEKIKEAKSCYQTALSNLEKISLEIHEQRKLSQLKLNLKERVPGEGCESPDAEGLVAMAKLAQFNLEKNKNYDDLDTLEAELDEFDYEKEWSDDEELDDSSFEELNESSEGEHCLTNPTTIRRLSSRHFRRQSSNISTDEGEEGSGKILKHRRSRKKLKSAKQDSLPEEEVFEKNTTERSNVKPEETDSSLKNMFHHESSDGTYDTLHGTSKPTLHLADKKLEDASDYDIFDDLCK